MSTHTEGTAPAAAGASIAYFNDRFLPLAEVAISPLDRGFIFGDGVYEVLPSYGGHFLALHRHLGRLSASLDFTRIPNPHDSERWAALLNELVARNGAADQAVYLQVTRGVAPRDHRFPAVSPTVFIMSRPFPEPDHKALAEGLAVILLDDSRWQHCHAKTTSLIANVLLRQRAQDADAAEAILHRDGRITEGAVSNVFAVIDDAVLTPPVGEELLPGVTRALVIGLCRQVGLNVREAEVTSDDLRTAREIWLTSSTRELMPVTRIDDWSVGDGAPGACWAQVKAAFGDLKDKVRRGEPVPL